MPCSMSVSSVFNLKSIENFILLLQKAGINLMLWLKEDAEHNSELSV